MKKKIPLIVLVLVLSLFVAAYLYIPKTYAIYGEALELARRDSFVRSTIGDNISDSLFAYSNIHRGLAKIEVAIAGEKGEGLLLIRGKKIEESWQLTSVLFEVDSTDRRHLIYSDKK